MNLYSILHRFQKICQMKRIPITTLFNRNLHGVLMAFPITHLLVADALLSRHPRDDADAAQFLLGALAPDAVHYREGFTASEKKDIGAAKKITHLCPISDERWGAVTDNEGWICCIKEFLQTQADPIAKSASAEGSITPALENSNNFHALLEGYAVHALTDCYNNMTLWHRFRTQHPAEAAKGYASGYYHDLQEIDIRLYLAYVKDSKIERLLAMAEPCDMPGLVSAKEIHAIRDNILYENYKGRVPFKSHEYAFVTYDETLEYIAKTADFIDELHVVNAMQAGGVH